MPITIVTSKAAAALKERRAMRQHLAPFIKKVFTTLNPSTPYMPNWHIDLIAEYLEAMYLGQILKLIVNVPPRSLKSECGSVALPAWLLGQDPGERVLQSSYSMDLSRDLSRKCRQIIESPWYRVLFPATVLAKDQNEKINFATTKNGHRITTSTGAGITGRGGNWLINDDPMDPKRANSDTERKNALNWYGETWQTRLDNPRTGREVVIMQRLHVEDVTGYLLAQGGYEHLMLPRIAEKKTIIIFPVSKKKMIRDEGHSLHPARVGDQEIERKKKSLKAHGFAAQEQQRPVPAGGSRIDLSWFPRYRQEPAGWDEVVLSYDTSFGKNAKNNPTAELVFKRKDTQWYLTSVFSEILPYPQLKRRVITAEQVQKPDAILIEDKASGISLIQDLEGLPVLPIEPEADKVTRMETQTPSIEAGLISLPDPEHIQAPWLHDLETNLLHFPSPVSWDELDGLSQFLKWIRKRDTKGNEPVAPFGASSSSYWKQEYDIEI